MDANNPNYVPPQPQPPQPPSPLPAPDSSDGFPPGLNPVTPRWQQQPNQDVGIRTMNNDFGAISASGGISGAEPKTFRPEDILGNEPSFSPAKPGVPSPNLPPDSRSNHTKALTISIGAVAALVAIIAGLYFFIFTKSAPPAPAPVAQTPPPAPVPVPETQPAFSHQSLFPASSGVSVAKADTQSITIESVNKAIANLFANQTKVPFINEVALTSGGSPVNGRQYLGAFLNLGADELKTKVDEDITLFAYKDKDGVWPGFAVKLNNGGTPLKNAPDILASIESSAKKFYLADPGAAKSAEFKMGVKPSANFKDVRYLVYGQAGASFNVAWAQIGGADYIVVNTSYGGLKESANDLGF